LLLYTPRRVFGSFPYALTPRSHVAQDEEEGAMTDLILTALALALFAVTVVYAAACERL